MKTNYFKSLASLVCVGVLFFSTAVNAQWSSVSGGAIGGPGVDAMIGYNADLYVGGGFFSPYSDIAKWNGSAYSNAGFTPTQGVLAFATFDSVLYIATYNAIYQDIGGSISTIATLNDPCYALCFYNHNLYAGGWMDSINHKFVGYLAKYNGSAWSSIAVPVDNWPKAMTIYNGQLAVGGYFNYSSANDTLYGVGLWDGSKWTHLNKGIKGAYGVFTMAVMSGNLYIGGGFDSVSYQKKHIYCNNIAMWNGTDWDSVGHGLTGGPYALTVFNGGLVAGGYFDSIKSWNGVAWSMLGTLPASSEVQALGVYNGNLYAGGQFTSVSGVPNTGYMAEYTIPTGVNEISTSSSISVYPNPNNGVFTMQLSGISGKSSVEVYNILGEKVYSQFTIDNSPLTINLKESAGIYLYRVLSADGNSIASGKVIVK
jgi:hypothetical protein